VDERETRELLMSTELLRGSAVTIGLRLLPNDSRSKDCGDGVGVGVENEDGGARRRR
jgi:hypothetical protein